MKLKDVHRDMGRYLEEGCYCPGEVYDLTGFFYEVFDAEDEIELVERSAGMKAVIMSTGQDAERPQAVLFWHDDDERPGMIVDAQRFDATPNNVGLLRAIVRGEQPEQRCIDEFKPGELAKAYREVLGMADTIMVG